MTAIDLSVKDWAHILSLLVFDKMKGNKQSEKLLEKLKKMLLGE